MRPAQPDDGEQALRTTVVRLCAYLAALIFYAAALDALGFIVSTVLVVVFILRIAEGYGWRTTLAIAVGTVVGLSVAVRLLARRDPARRLSLGQDVLPDDETVAAGVEQAWTYCSRSPSVSARR